MNKQLSKKSNIVFFVGPALIVFLVFGLFPILYNIYISLFKTNLLSDGTFVGLKNYIRLFHDDTLTKAFFNNIKLIIGSYVAQMGIGLLISWMLYNKKKGSRLYQSVYFMPSVICGTAIGLLWKFIYNADFGLVNSVLKAIGLDSLQNNWLADKTTVMPAILVMVMWAGIGYHVVIQLAAMRDIDVGILEAAMIDGAGNWTKFVKIVLPTIKPVLAVDSVLIITNVFKLFDKISVITGGGPNHASEVLSTYMYQKGFEQLEFGYASSIGVVMLVLCLGVYMCVNAFFGTNKEQ